MQKEETINKTQVKHMMVIESKCEEGNNRKNKLESHNHNARNNKLSDGLKIVS